MRESFSGTVAFFAAIKIYSYLLKPFTEVITVLESISPTLTSSLRSVPSTFPLKSKESLYFLPFSSVTYCVRPSV